ncbi:hypothetical protein MD484_g3231, partial [Candolleomyces efflorescens]
MSTATVQTMPRATHTTTSRGAGNQSSSVCIKDLMINELTDGAPSGTTDEGFYSADLFDALDEENFIQAQRDAFSAINDAALARAIQESEIFAAKKAAEENRRRMANASATGRESRASSSAASHIPPASLSAGPYALLGGGASHIIIASILSATISLRPPSCEIIIAIEIAIPFGFHFHVDLFTSIIIHFCFSPISH